MPLHGLLRDVSPSAARDWESDTPQQLEKEVSLTALDVLRVVSRSRRNRAQLLSLGILPSLTRLMKARSPVAAATMRQLHQADSHLLDLHPEAQLPMLLPAARLSTLRMLGP